MNTERIPVYFVVYKHINPKTKEVFYIGNGKIDRPYNFHGRSDAWHVYVDTYGEPEIEIVATRLTKHRATKLEMELIAEYGRICKGDGTLINKLPGGPSVPVKRKYYKKPITFYLPDELQEKIDIICQEEERTEANAIIRILRLYLGQKFPELLDSGVHVACLVPQ